MESMDSSSAVPWPWEGFPTRWATRASTDKHGKVAGTASLTPRQSKKKQELEDMLAHILSEDYVRQYLSRWSDSLRPSSSVRNPHALSGTLRDRFLARLLENRPSLEGAKTRYKDGGASICPLQIVFHGTPENNIDSILCQGLLPECRRFGNYSDWFGGSPAAAKSYCKKLLVFLVLHTGGAGATAPASFLSAQLGAVTLKCATYQLPIGTVELTKFAGQ